MFVIDKVITALAPSDTAERRIKARSKMHDLGRHCEWLRRVVQQHEQIEQAIDRVAEATDSAAGRRAERTLATLLTGHSVAEEAVLYPALASAHQKAHSIAAFAEQAHVKVHLAALESLEPRTSEYLATLGRLKEVVLAHVFDEECSWFPALARTGDAQMQARLSARFVTEYERYMGVDGF